MCGSVLYSQRLSNQSAIYFCGDRQCECGTSYIYYPKLTVSQAVNFQISNVGIHIQEHILLKDIPTNLKPLYRVCNLDSLVVSSRLFSWSAVPMRAHRSHAQLFNASLFHNTHPNRIARYLSHNPLRRLRLFSGWIDSSGTQRLQMHV